jgi:hypothetical protein
MRPLIHHFTRVHCDVTAAEVLAADRSRSRIDVFFTCQRPISAAVIGEWNLRPLSFTDKRTNHTPTRDALVYETNGA